MQSPTCLTSFGVAEVKSIYMLRPDQWEGRYVVNVTVKNTGLNANFHNIDQSFADKFLGGIHLDEMYKILNDEI